jgi:hypothetical protein
MLASELGNEIILSRITSLWSVILLGGWRQQINPHLLPQVMFFYLPDCWQASLRIPANKKTHQLSLVG